MCKLLGIFFVIGGVRVTWRGDAPTTNLYSYSQDISHEWLTLASELKPYSMAVLSEVRNLTYFFAPFKKISVTNFSKSLTPKKEHKLQLCSRNIFKGRVPY